MHTQHQYDVLIVGSGAAGLTLALRLPARARVAVLSKGPLQEGNTLYAQGGISAVLDQEDSIESHVEDTMEAGAGLCTRRWCAIPWNTDPRRSVADRPGRAIHPKNARGANNTT